MFDVIFGVLIIAGMYFALKYIRNTRHCRHNCNECKHPCRTEDGDCTMKCVRGKNTGGKHNGRKQTGKTQN